MEMVQLVKICLQFLCSSDTETFVEKSTSYADRHEMNIGALKGSLRGLLNFFKGAARKYLSQALIQEDMMRFGFDENRAKIVASSWQAHFLALSRGIAGQTLVVNKLVDMDWRFGVTSSSSELKQVGRTFLQLRLQLDKGNGAIETTNMELSLPQFYEFLQEMEKAKAAMEFLT
uniref:COMM domain-containing protein n=1 Tax=Guillardia theta TaxID=55529 RepID=A0A6U6CFY0_GUITH|mmetsp:Transcript_4597/g.16737  ORF Transcript_4597/g.16737 Transcript_4597/m.16737 type:complete len:174 (+) Transcript_4597:234-755(+)